MDRTKQKAKKEKPNKHVEKDKSPSVMADVKTIKENLKIREILRTVKMNSSMRMKAPRGSKVMQNKDFTDNEDFDDTTSNGSQHSSEPPSATNTLVVNNNSDTNLTTEDDCVNDNEPSEAYLDEYDGIVRTDIETGVVHKSKSLSEGLEEAGRERVSAPVSPVTPTVLPPLESSLLRTRDRKLSLDHTMLSKREGLSQSEVDLHSIGKSPLERKSSFFRKKMDSFLKNTTEIFKRQSLGNKSSQSVQRRGSTSSRISVSMQSLNENEAYNDEYDGEALDKYNEEMRGSVTSLRSSATVGRSHSSLSVGQSDRVPADQSEDDSLAGSRPGLDGQPLGDKSSTSVNNLNESYHQESFLHSRAISMSSGLDTAHKPRNRKTSRSNRVTWVASESLTDYFRRLIQDEKTGEIQVSHSYQDFSAIPENKLYGSPRSDSKGRRLSYQRAVSGEDPVLPTKYHDSSLRRRKITESSEAIRATESILAEFKVCGIPPLQGLELRVTPDNVLFYRLWARNQNNLERHLNWEGLPKHKQRQQAVIKELIHTETDHINFLLNVVEVYVATAHALQIRDRLVDLDTSRIFSNMPDVINSSLLFWELVLHPMVSEMYKNKNAFNVHLMSPGMSQFPEIFEAYEDYVCYQSKAIGYLNTFSNHVEVSNYVTWCQNYNPLNRLQLSDLLVKPMQRLTQYHTIFERLIDYTEDAKEKAALEYMRDMVVAFLQHVNRAIRQDDEMRSLREVTKELEPFEIEFKDEELDKHFRENNRMRLKGPMLGCAPNNSRSVVFQGDLHFKDNLKEGDVRIILLTDTLLVCKKITRGGNNFYKMIRPKYYLDKLAAYPRGEGGSPLEATSHTFVVLDDYGDSAGAFRIRESSKDVAPLASLKRWNQAFYEAKLAYELSKFYYSIGCENLQTIELENELDDIKKTHQDEWNVERKAHERVAAMMHTSGRRPSTTNDPGPSRRASSDARRPPTLWQMYLKKSDYDSRNSIESSIQISSSSRHSRMSSRNKSFSYASPDDLPEGLKESYKSGSSADITIPSLKLDHGLQPISSKGEDPSAGPSQQPSPPTVVLQEASPYLTPSPRSASAGGNQNCLLVAPVKQGPQMHSMPDLSNKLQPRLLTPPPVQLSASEKLYKSHYDSQNWKRFVSESNQFLSPNQRGTSYPPLKPPRLLKRDLTMSQHPPLTRKGHGYSHSQSNIDQIHVSVSQPHICPERERTSGASKGKKSSRMVSAFLGGNWSSKIRSQLKKWKSKTFTRNRTTGMSSSSSDQSHQPLVQPVVLEDYQKSLATKRKQYKLSSKMKTEASLSLSN